MFDDESKREKRNDFEKKTDGESYPIEFSQKTHFYGSMYGENPQLARINELLVSQNELTLYDNALSSLNNAQRKVSFYNINEMRSSSESREAFKFADGDRALISAFTVGVGNEGTSYVIKVAQLVDAVAWAGGFFQGFMFVGLVIYFMYKPLQQLHLARSYERLIKNSEATEPYRQPKLSWKFLAKYQIVKMGCGMCLKENTEGIKDVDWLDADEDVPEDFFYSLVSHYDNLNKEARKHLSLHFLTKIGQKVKPTMDSQMTTSAQMHVLTPMKDMSRNSNVSALNSAQPG